MSKINKRVIKLTKNCKALIVLLNLINLIVIKVDKVI